MHATGYLETRSRHPVALVAAISINLAVVGGMLAYTTDILPRIPEGIPLIPIPKDPPIVKVEPPKTPLTKTTQTPLRPVPAPPIPLPPIDPTVYRPQWPDTPPLPPTPTGPEVAAKPDPAPVERIAEIDGRYAGDLQPAYPPALERQEIEGKATVKVQVGIDGRVTAVELVRADDPGFFNATRDQALRRWRFKPATRDGQPIVSWVTKTVVFTIRR